MPQFRERGPKVDRASSIQIQAQLICSAFVWARHGRFRGGLSSKLRRSHQAHMISHLVLCLVGVGPNLKH